MSTVLLGMHFLWTAYLSPAKASRFMEKDFVDAGQNEASDQIWGHQNPPLEKVPSHVSRDAPSAFEPPPEDEYFPEGGRAAWLVLLGCFCAWMCAFGLMNTVGTFQAYLETHQLSAYSQAEVGWIFGLYLFMAYCCGVQAGPIFDAIGPRALTAVGSIFIVASMFLLGVCHSKCIVHSSPRHKMIHPIADIGPRILPLHYCFWNPWWCRDITTLHRGNWNNWPLLQRPPWFCYRPSQLCRISRRRLVPSNALFSLHLRRLRLGNKSSWLDIHLPPHYRKHSHPLPTSHQTILTNQHTTKP